jgi:hypothetical protein
MTAVPLDTDPRQAAAHLAMADHLTAPFAGGMPVRVLGVDGNGLVTVPEGTRRPLLLIAPAVALLRQGLRVEATPPGTPMPVVLQFAPFTEAGAHLPVVRPQANPDTGVARPMAVSLRAWWLDEGDGAVAVDTAVLGTVLQGGLVEGDLGALLYVLGSEHARLRRQARTIAAARRLRLGRDDALDRHGADLGVPRFGEQLTISGSQLEVTAQREADADYRRRLAIYRPLTVPTARTALGLANGPGSPTDPSAGLLAGLGPAPRLAFTDADEPFAVAVHLLSVGPDQVRQGLLKFITTAHLVDPATDVPAHRPLPSTMRTVKNRMRARLRAAFTFPPGSLLPPSLALALDTLARVRTALGEPASWAASTPVSGAPASRYELWAGIDLALPPPAELDRLRTKLLAADRAPAADPATEGVLAALTTTLAGSPAGTFSSANDPAGAWLLHGCGLLTAHRTGTGVYVSAFPVHGLVVDAPSTFPSPGPMTVAARYLAPTDPAGNAALVEGVAAVISRWRGPGNGALVDVPPTGFGTSAHPLPKALSDALQTTRFVNAAQALVLGDPSALPEQVTAALALPVDYVRWLQVPPSVLSGLQSSDTTVKAAALAALGDLRNRLQAATLGAALPLHVNGSFVLGVGVIPLPVVGHNVTARQAFGFRWDVVPLTPLPTGVTPTVDTTNHVTTFTAPARGLYALVVTGYVRPARPDPYEVRPDVPGTTSLNFAQYELLLNLLAHCRALGVSIDTEPLRWGHVKGSGLTAPPLPAPIATGYRPYRSRRFRGEVGIPVELVSSVPVIASISTGEVQQRSTTRIVVSGTRLAGASAITISGAGVTGTVASQTDTDVQVDLTVGADAALTVRTFTLATAAGTANSADTNVTFRVGPRPLVQSVAPARLQQGGTITLTLGGQGLAGAAGLQFTGGGLTVTSVTSTDGSITAAVAVDPTATLSSRTFSVSTTRGPADTGTLSVTVEPRPLVTGLSPRTLEQGRTTTVTMAGQGLAGATAAGTSFGPGVSIQSLTATDSSVAATLILANDAALSVRTPSMLTTRGSADFAGIAVTVTPRPLVTSMSPNAVQQGTTSVVACSGQGLGAVTGASFSGAGVTATVASVAAGSVVLSVSAAQDTTLVARSLTLTMAGDTVDTSAVQLSVAPRPIVRSMSLTSVRQDTTVSLTLTGQGLSGASSLNLDAGITVSPLQAINDSTVTASLTVDRLAALTARSVSLTTPRGTAEATGLSIIVTPQPRLFSVSPIRGTQNTTIKLTFSGQALDSPANLSLGDLITVHTITSVDASTFQVSISIHELAEAAIERTPSLTAGGQAVDSNGVVFTVRMRKHEDP